MKSFLLLPSLLSLTLAGCGVRSPLQEPVIPTLPPMGGAVKAAEPDTMPTSPLLAAVAARQSAAGAPVELRLSVQNTSAEPVTLDFRSGQSFDFQAFRPGESDAAWTWSMDKMFTEALREHTLAPGEKIEFEARWEGAPAGTYEMEGSLTTFERVKAPRVTLEVK